MGMFVFYQAGGEFYRETGPGSRQRTLRDLSARAPRPSGAFRCRPAASALSTLSLVAYLARILGCCFSEGCPESRFLYKCLAAHCLFHLLHLLSRLYVNPIAAGGIVKDYLCVTRIDEMTFPGQARSNGS